MDPDFAQRRRIFIAAAVTVIAVPAAFLLGRDDTTAEPGPPTTLWAPVGATAPDPAGAAAAAAADAAQPSDAPSDLDTISHVLGTTPGGYLSGTVAEDANDTPMIAVPRPRDTIVGTATFSDAIDRTTTCIIPQVLMGTEVTITNLDNSRSVKCQVVAIGTPQSTDVTMHVGAFSQIADITEAPVPVEISW